MEQNTTNQPKPSNNLVLAIITTACCCLPLGIVAIVKASKVNSYYLARQYELAEQASKDAKKWSIIGIISGIVINIIYYVFMGIYGDSMFATLSKLGQ